MNAYPLLSLAIWLPIIGGALVLLSGGENRLQLSRSLSLVISVATLLITLPLYQGFDEYMNLVMADAEEVHMKTKERKPVGKILLKGDNIT